MADRVEIHNELAARVLFASDRQCCICRDGNTKTQIHHIDGDPSNNAFENLAVICLNCHSQAHSKEAFVRNLTPGMIQLYNESWRALVKIRLIPAVDPQGLTELASEALLELSLNCHLWKLTYMSYYPEFHDMDGSSFSDIWEMMMEMGAHPYSKEEWVRYRPLFIDAINRLLGHFDRALTLYPEILSVPFKTLLIRTRRRLETTQRVYSIFPELIAQIGDVNPGLTFKEHFTEAIQAIRDVAREADRQRKALTEQPGTSVTPRPRT